jgi:hypothetical protein
MTPLVLGAVLDAVIDDLRPLDGDRSWDAETAQELMRAKADNIVEQLMVADHAEARRIVRAAVKTAVFEAQSIANKGGRRR